MRNKATLTLMELSIMLAVFALAAALCMRGFVWAAETADTCGARDQALVEVQNAAEVLKSCRGDLEGAAERFGGSQDAGVWTVRYNEQWEQVLQGGVYTLRVERTESKVDLLGTAEIRMLSAQTCLIELETAWQEESPDGA